MRMDEGQAMLTEQPEVLFTYHSLMGDYDTMVCGNKNHKRNISDFVVYHKGLSFVANARHGDLRTCGRFYARDAFMKGTLLRRGRFRGGEALTEGTLSRRGRDREGDAFVKGTLL